MIYILVDTWNGEGYSDSRAEIIQAKDYGQALEKAIEKAKQCAGGNKVRVFNKKRVQYDIGDDSGSIHLLPYEGQYGLCIFPDVNEFTMLPSEATYTRALNQSAKLCDDKDDVAELKQNGQGTIHTGIGCEIFQKFSELDFLEFDEEGDTDGLTYETWVNTYTHEKYRVPISVERDFANMEKL